MIKTVHYYLIKTVYFYLVIYRRVKKLANKTQCNTDIQHNGTKIQVS